MNAHTLVRNAVMLFGVVMLASTAAAQTQVATVASAAGTVEVRRAGKGEWQVAGLGDPVFVSDAVRTGAGGFAKLVFVDDGVVDVGASTEVTIDDYAGGKSKRSLLRLAQGKLEALVSGAEAESARYEVETPTAVARAQATDFIVSYDGAQKATEVVGIEGTVAVRGTTGIIGPGVAVGPNEMTHVPRDGFPSPVKTLDEAQARQAQQGLRVIGTGLRDGLDVGDPIAEGRMVAATDRLPAPGTAAAPRAGNYLRPGVPGETLLYSLSPDNRANNQPLPDYRAVPPNESPVPPH
jgi:hypothetical protein